MGMFFVDETIQTRGGFILAAIVYFDDDPSSAVDAALQAVGLTPRVDEFHSSDRLAGNTQLQALRSGIFEILRRDDHYGKIAVVVAPVQDRRLLGTHVLEALKKVIEANSLEAARHDVYFDQGISFGTDRTAAGAFARSYGAELHAEQNSRLVPGIQVADLVAHTAGIMLLDSLGLVTKTVRLGPESGYEPDTEFDLGFEMWASLRWHFFSSSEGVTVETDDDIERALRVPAEEYALHVSVSCSPELREAAVARFGVMYRGCIH